MHWCINHDYKLCNLCSNYAFKYDSDRIQHEQLHLPFGCSSCKHEFVKYDEEIISQHYKEAHQSFLCEYCSGVIQPYSKYPDHVERKHNTLSYSKLVERSNRQKLFNIIDNNHFICLICDKKRNCDTIFGHFHFYHSLTVHNIKKVFDQNPQIKVNGATLHNDDIIQDIEDISDNQKDQDEYKEKCSVCENPLDEEISKAKELHGVFCQGHVVCSQKDCIKVFESENDLSQHIDSEHQATNCKFGCNATSLNPLEVNDHLQSLHDIIECFLCNIINSSGQFKNHLRDQHSVDLMVFEKAMSKAKSKLYRLEKTDQVLCNFCDQNLTDEVKEFSFIDHYKDKHEINITAILRNLNKNPIIDVIINNKLSKNKDALKNFAIIKSLEKFVETDFDTSKVSCIGVEHVEQKPFLVVDNDSTLTCDFCNKTFEVACRLYEHLTAMHGFRLLNLNDCDECHSKWQQNESDSAGSDEDNKDFNLSLVCPLDESNHVTKINFKHHMEEEHLDESLGLNKIIYKCLVCCFTYKNLDDIRNHFKKNHPDVKMNYCKLCRIKLPSNGCDDDHFEKNHAMAIKKSEKFCCNFCKKEFKRSAAAMSHYEKLHHTTASTSSNLSERGFSKVRSIKRAYKCQLSECELKFENKEDRKMHIIYAHPNAKIYQCKVCNMDFTTKGSLTSHSMKHKNLSLVCEVCQKIFTRTDSYKEHLLIHSDVRQKCSFCDKVFVQRSNLVRHERIHLQDKPYKCSYCEKTFSDKGACTSHEKVHTREEASNCEVCGKHFARKQKLKYHMRLHTLENVLTCDYCGKIFAESYSYKKHREIHTKGVNDRSLKNEQVNKLIILTHKLYKILINF